MWNDKGKAYPSLKPLAGWLVDLEKRLCFVNFWKDSGIPNVFWVSGFFFPQAFMTGALQNFARKYTKPIDTVSFGFSVIDRVVPPTEEAPRDFHGAEPWVTEHVRPADGVLISGLYFEGARWDSHTQVHFCIYPTLPPKPPRPLLLPLRLPPWRRRRRSHHTHSACTTTTSTSTTCTAPLKHSPGARSSRHALRRRLAAHHRVEAEGALHRVPDHPPGACRRPREPNLGLLPVPGVQDADARGDALHYR
jgi:hypothetical protein